MGQTFLSAFNREASDKKMRVLIMMPYSVWVQIQKPFPPDGDRAPPLPPHLSMRVASTRKCPEPSTIPPAIEKFSCARNRNNHVTITPSLPTSNIFLLLSSFPPPVTTKTANILLHALVVLRHHFHAARSLLLRGKRLHREPIVGVNAHFGRCEERNEGGGG